MIDYSKLKITIENPKGSHKSFEIDNDPLWKNYPLSGVTYPVDYGYIAGYASEDEAELDVFMGSGNLNGYIKISRMDVPEETKFFIKLTHPELNNVLEVFHPVLLEHNILDDETFIKKLETFRE